MQDQVKDLWDKGYDLGYDHGFRAGYMQAKNSLTTDAMNQKLKEAKKGYEDALSTKPE